MAKRTPESDRKRLIEAQRKKARAKERRTTILIIAVCAVLGVLIVGSAVYFGTKNKSAASSSLDEIGVTKEAAACDAVAEEKATGSSDHTARDGDPVQYDKIPPTSGRHNPTPLPVGRKKFYTRTENPPPERAVHNLEHGYMVIWYDSKVTEPQLKTLEDAATAAEGKFLFVPWQRGDFEGDKHIGLTAWGHKQMCGDVSGAAIQAFFDEHGGNNGDAPEKGAI